MSKENNHCFMIILKNDICSKYMEEHYGKSYCFNSRFKG